MTGAVLDRGFRLQAGPKPGRALGRRAERLQGVADRTGGRRHSSSFRAIACSWPLHGVGTRRGGARDCRGSFRDLPGGLLVSHRAQANLRPTPACLRAGNVDVIAQPGIAVVGTRHPTPYGLGMAERLSCDLAARGLIIFSGLARGSTRPRIAAQSTLRVKPWPFSAPEWTSFIRRKTRG